MLQTSLGYDEYNGGFGDDLGAFGDDDLGFSIKNIAKTALNPIAATKKSLAVTKTVAKAAGKGAVVVGKGIVKLHTIPTKWTIDHIAAPLTKKILSPVKSRVQTLVSRRASKIAWDKRKSKTPTPAEREEARAWTKAKLKPQLPHGPLLALLAGPPDMSETVNGWFHGAIELGVAPVAPAVLAALVPVLIALINATMSRTAKSGEAPVTISADVAPRPGESREQYLARVQQAGIERLTHAVSPGSPEATLPGPDEAAAAAAAAGDEGGGGGSGDEAPERGAPSGASRIKMGTVLIVGGALVAIVVLMRSSGGGKS